MAGDLTSAIDQAMAFCWNENYGYNYGGMGHSYADGFDCSGFVGRVLHDNGFNYPSSHVGTAYMDSYLISAGFTKLNFSWNFQPQSGDIFVMNHYGTNPHGHTFFYVEDIRAYTDPNANSANIAVIHRAKVEASSDRGHSSQGDHRKNGTGAYWEVWCHAYNHLVTNVNDDPQYGYTASEVKVYRYPGGYQPNILPSMGLLFMKLLSGSRYHVRRLKGII